MRTWDKVTIVAVVAGGLIIAALAIDRLPAFIGFALAVAGAVGWSRQLGDSAAAPLTSPAEAAVPAAGPDQETVYVIGRTRKGTRRAMAEAGRLADDRAARLVVLVVEKPHGSVPLDVAAIESIRRGPGATAQRSTVVSCRCRRPAELAPLLPPASIVVIERRGPDWWPSFERRLADTLKRSGCRVAVA